MKDANSLSVWVAEDDLDDRRLIQLALEDLAPKYRAQFTRDGSELLERLRSLLSRGEQPPDFFLLDANMPVMNGKETLRELKRLPEIASIPVFVWSTHVSEDEILFFDLSGAAGFVVKPSSYSTLVQIIELLGDRVARPAREFVRL